MPLARGADPFCADPDVEGGVEPASAEFFPPALPLSPATARARAASLVDSANADDAEVEERRCRLYRSLRPGSFLKVRLTLPLPPEDSGRAFSVFTLILLMRLWHSICFKMSDLI